MFRHILFATDFSPASRNAFTSSVVSVRSGARKVKA